MRFVCDSCRAQYMISDDKVGAKGVKVRCKKCGYVILVRKPDAEAGEESTKVTVNPFAGENAGADAPALADEPETRPPADPEAMAASDSSDQPFGGEPSRPPTDPNNVLGGLEDDEIGAVFDQVLKTSPKAAEPSINSLELPKDNENLNLNMDDTESTRVLSMDALKKLAEETGAAGEGAIPRSSAESGQAEKKVPLTDWFVAVDDNQIGPLNLDKVKEMWERGEIGAESLCWRAGFSDWIPVSEVADLAAELAPRPSKPVIVAPANLTGPTPMAALPVESAFSPRSSPARAESPMLAHADPGPTESGSWKPSAASALASLAMEEVAALSKPAVATAREKEQDAPSVGGLLDLPPPEASPSTAHAGAVALAPNQLGSRTPSHHDPRSAPVLSPGYSSVSAPYPQPAYNTYTPPAPPPPRSNNRLLLIVGGSVGVVVVALLVAVLVVLSGQRQPPVAFQGLPQNAIAQAPTQPVAPPAGNVQQPATAPAVAPTTAPATAPQPAVASGAGQVQPARAEVPMPPPPPGVRETPKEQPKEVASAKEPTPSSRGSEESSTGSERHHRSRSSSSSEGSSGASRKVSRDSSAEAEEAPAPTKPSKASSGGGGDDFDSIFGSKSADSAPSEQPKKKKDTGYIPPAPGGGGGGDVPEQLNQGDIMAVVLANKPSLVNCVSEQKKRSPGVSGKLVMQWDISPGGKTSAIQVVSDEYKSTYMASCITGLIKGWQFPRHKVKGDPVKFPFGF